MCNNAGISGSRHISLLDETFEEFDRVMRINALGVMVGTQAAAQHMAKNGGGSIINVASIAGIYASFGVLSYRVAKAGVVQFSKCAAIDLGQHGIRVNCICPGRVETPFVSARLKEYPDPKKAYEEMSSTQALGRMGRPEEIAAAALYLASDESSFVTGTAFLIDGGWSAGK